MLHHTLPPFDLFPQRLDLALDLLGEGESLRNELARLCFMCLPKRSELRLQLAA